MVFESFRTRHLRVLVSAGICRWPKGRGKLSTLLSTGQTTSLVRAPLAGFTCPSASCSKSGKSDINKHLTATSGPSLSSSVLPRSFQFWIGSWHLLLFCTLFESRMFLKGTCGKILFPSMVLCGGGRNFKEWEVSWLLGRCHLSFLYFASPTPGGGIALLHMLPTMAAIAQSNEISWSWIKSYKTVG